MDYNFICPIEGIVESLFSEMNVREGEGCNNPVTGRGFVWDFETIPLQKELAIAALRARERLTIYGPPDAPLLPFSLDDIEDFRKARGLKGVVGFYARSLSRRNYDAQTHPSFDDFARGLMAINTGLWGIEKDENLKKRFPPHPLEGMTPSACWVPPEEYAEYMASYRRTH